MITDLKLTFDELRSAFFVHASPHRPALNELPEGLYDFWRKDAHRQWAGIPRDFYFFTRAAEGLLAYFACASLDILPCALPSRAADSVWQAWTRFAPARLDAFCVKHYKRPIAWPGSGTTPAALERTLMHARALACLPKDSSTLPSLFQLDRKLVMPRGFGYSTAQSRVYYQYLDASGKPEGTYYFLDTHLAPAAHFTYLKRESGLVSQAR